MSNTKVKTSIELISAINKKYIQEFGEMDDRAYFMSGFVSTVLNELADS